MVAIDSDLGVQKGTLCCCSTLQCVNLQTNHKTGGNDRSLSFQTFTYLFRLRLFWLKAHPRLCARTCVPVRGLCENAARPGGCKAALPGS